MKAILIVLLIAGIVTESAVAQKRLVLIDQDGSGPGGSNQMAMMVFLQSPNVEVLGITMVTGNAWRDEEMQHTLRMLEIIGRTDVPVIPGAVFPLVRGQKETMIEEALYGKWTWLGAWGQGPTTLAQTPNGMTPTKVATPTIPPSDPNNPYSVPSMPEGAPHTKPLDEDAAHFLIRQVHAHPHEVTIFAGGPLTNIALAISIDPHFAELTKGIIIMGGSLDPQTGDPEFSTSPRHEFNFWFDPEAVRITLHAAWPRVDVTTVDISIKAMFSQAMLDEISKSPNPAAQYIAKYSQDRYYLWDELTACAWLDPSIITGERKVYMDVDVGHGPTYGDTLTWTEDIKPETGVRLVHAQTDVDLPKFSKMFVELMSAPTPK